MSELNKEISDYTKNLNKASKDENINRAVTRAVKSFRTNVASTLARFPHTVALAAEVREIKASAVKNNKELLEKAMASIERNHGSAYFAKDGDEAIKIVDQIIGKDKVVIKGKSMLGEEIQLRHRLEELGNEVWETDLGEFILQLKNDRPMHILSPAVHVPREQIAEIFSNFFQKEVPPDIPAEVAAVREFLRDKYFKADVGISGSNVVAADTGQIVIIENEGNVRLVTGTPPVHIVIVGIEKVVPSFQDAMKVAEVNWRYAQYDAPSYVNVISGPSKTGDIEKVITYGAHGPKEFHVIFLDNGRSEMINNLDYNQALFCLRCGGCMYECPVFQVTAGHYGRTYLSGIGSIWTAFVDGGPDVAAPMLYTCLRCGRCVEQCPMKIDVPKMVGELRSKVVED
ncbi:Lactate utilization protein B/C [Syntrophobotulus glycolicus DSM 8271]|uniref:Lactate utilization protein B/C n=1 Tax=Syntrophobotulus glycolicus (strain DSM 8271 / FlGlyR) TaxID=645991 RepID=F0T1I2_SYNGF|nr:lactate utilization protein B [Syntrophobotulus glycolicus]ADY56323.1 Lactate utilization protein B/C [Syntrophobotulus glycolicus DSM 8271]